MANRIVGSVYIIDSEQVATALPFDGKMNIGTVAFWGVGSLSILELSGPTTTNVVAKIQIEGNDGGTNSVFVNTTFDEVYVPTLISGTAFLYLR